MIRPRVAEAAPWHPDDHRHAATPPVPDLRCVVDELIEASGDEVVELNLANRSLACERGANADPKNAPFSEGRIDDPISECSEKRPQQQERVPVGPADILTVQEHTRIRCQRVSNAEHHTFKK